MKFFTLCCFVLAPNVLGADLSTGFGPKGCVSLYRSKAGSCVLQTKCSGVDTSKVEFAFDCKTPSGEVQRHSFGQGGFDETEVFDTSVQCSQCLAPKSAHVEVHNHNEKTNVAAVGNSEFVATFVASDVPADAAKYGPGNCVSVWRNSNTSHCHVKTQCKGQDIKGMMFGLLCEEESKNSKSPVRVRHLFGRNSFLAEEEFDTLIVCKHCLALDKVPEDVELEQQVEALAKDVGEIKKDMEGLTANVAKIKEAVGDKDSKDSEDGKKDSKDKDAKKDDQDSKKDGTDVKKDDVDAKKDDSDAKKDDADAKKDDDDAKKDGKKADTSFLHSHGAHHEQVAAHKEMPATEDTTDENREDDASDDDDDADDVN